VTVVIPLKTFQKDFEGGLYVSTGAGKEFYLPLSAGDAVFHQSTLLHGVRVTSGERWSWILWLKNSPQVNVSCDAVDSMQWTEAGAVSGDPLAQFLHAGRARSKAESLAWLRKSAEGGFARAANELGQALVEGTKGIKNREEGRQWLQVAAEAGEPEALYNLGLLYLGDNVTAAVELFREAGERGVGAACKNMGVAYYNGRGGVEKNWKIAREWFLRAGDASSMLLASQIALATAGEESNMEL